MLILAKKMNKNVKNSSHKEDKNQKMNKRFSLVINLGVSIYIIW